jgi:hypothetical protein
MRHSLSLEQTRSFTHAHPTAALWAAAAFALLAACGGGYGGGGGGGIGSGCGGAYGSSCPAPTINMSSPGSTVNRTVQLTASASAMGGATVTRVDFLVDGTIVGTATAAPYTFSWDSTSVGDGNHTLTAKVTDSQSQSATSTAITVNVDNNPAFAVTLSAAQIFPAPTSSATGTATLTVKLGTGAVSGRVTLNGVNATAVTINEGFAGSTGAGVITLTANAGTAAEWDVASGALLTPDQVTALLEGRLYVIATSAANPAGELRGQITPANVTVTFAALAGSQEVPPLTSSAAGVAAATVDALANKLTVHVNSTGVNDATAAEVDTAAAGATGPKLVALTKDNVNAGHWSTELAGISAADVGNYTANKWYINVVTPADPNGALRGQINATAAPPPAAVTLTQLKTTAFVVCAGCHTGGGSALPFSMDLHPAQIYASTVGVASVEQPALKRVAPGDAANSYVVQKLEGAPTITGARMPFGGPYLDQATIDQVKAWINAGAQNN